MRCAEELIHTVGLPNNGGPDVFTIPVRLSDVPGPKYIEGWIGNFGSSNIYVVSGAMSLAQCQDLLERNFVDVILVLTGSGPVHRRLPDNVGVVTVFFEAVNTSGQFETATLRFFR